MGNMQIGKGIAVSGNSIFNHNLTVSGLIEAKGRVNKGYSKGYYAKGTSSKWNDHPAETKPVSIYAHDRIVGHRIITYSDVRLKEDISNLSTSTIIEQFKNLQVKNYYYKNESSLKNVGFIAQEVEKTIPEAVDKIAGVAPNICRLAKIRSLDKESVVIEKEDSEIEVGDIVRLISNKEYDVDVIAINKDTFTVKKWTDDTLDRVFLYGTKMNDLRAIDYRYIFTLNVAVTQRLSQQVARLAKELSALKQEKSHELQSVAVRGYSY